MQAYDPVAIHVAGRMLPDVRLVETAYQAAEGVDALVLVTEWNEFRQLDMGRIRRSMRRGCAHRRSQHLEPGRDDAAWASAMAASAARPQVATEPVRVSIR